jgi:hypothetical protein
MQAGRQDQCEHNKPFPAARKHEGSLNLNCSAASKILLDHFGL